MTNQRILATFLILTTSIISTPAADWPEFRGPTGQGLAGDDKLPQVWTAEKNVAWKQSIPGKGWSSPVIVDGKVYLTTAVPQVSGTNTDQKLEALCLDASNGKILWETPILVQDGAKAPRIHGKNSHASPTPIVSGKRVYVHFGHAGTACLTLDGDIIWKNTDLNYSPVHGNGGSPVLVDDLLIFSSDGSDKQFIVALESVTGKVKWQTERKTTAAKKFSFNTPLVITVKDQKQVISAGSDVVCAFDPANGKEIWRVRYEGYSVIPRPVYAKGLVFVSSSYDTPTLLAIRPDGSGDVTDSHVAWTTKEGAPKTPSPLVVGDELYMVSDDGKVSCRDAKTGDLHWSKQVRGHFSASPLAAGGKIYLQSEEGVGFVLAAGKEFNKLAENDLGERSLASYAAVGGALFIRTEKQLFRIEEK
jgi:outer membrane protein assembly factor BamB